MIRTGSTSTRPHFEVFVRCYDSAISAVPALFKTILPEMFTSYLEAFADYPVLQKRVLSVLQLLPEEVQRDFLDDARFGVTIDNYEPDKGWSLFMPTPGPPGQGSRRVVLRPKLNDTSEGFAKYIIAHEFAHAFLRNGGWGDITDVEEAADALAASWGFERPARFG